MHGLAVSSVTSSISSCLLPYVGKRLQFPLNDMPFFLVAMCLQDFIYILFTNNFQKSLDYFHYYASSMNRFATFYMQVCISLYPQAANLTWINFTPRQFIFCNTSTDYYFGFPNINFKTFSVEYLTWCMSLCKPTISHRLVAEFRLNLLPCFFGKCIKSRKIISWNSIWSSPLLVQEKCTS